MYVLRYLEVFLLSICLEKGLTLSTRSKTFRLTKSRERLSDLMVKQDNSVLKCSVSCAMAPTCKGFRFSSVSCRLYGKEQRTLSKRKKLNEEQVFLLVPEMDTNPECVERSPAKDSKICLLKQMTAPYICKNHANIWKPWVASCNSTCFEVVDGKALYTGNVSVTGSGKKCQRWDSNTPHNNVMQECWFIEKSFTDAVNYCRDPDGEKKPWCYTTNPLKRWEMCDIPPC